MKKISVKNRYEHHAGIDILNEDIHKINSDIWNIGCNVEASFCISHDEQHIYLKYFVQELNIKAVHEKFNDPVYEDSCVEFFVSFDKVSYYNLEFNCIGTILGAYGKNRNSRQQLDIDLLRKIKVKPSLGTNKINIVDSKTKWTLDAVIPISVFKFSNLTSLKHKTAYCNFYKCGDKQVVPHFLSWNPVLTDEPDFHRPEYFGELDFS